MTRQITHENNGCSWCGDEALSHEPIGMVHTSGTLTRPGNESCPESFGTRSFKVIDLLDTFHGVIYWTLFIFTLFRTQHPRSDSELNSWHDS